MARRRRITLRATMPEGALTAAAQRATGEKAERYRRLNQQWQLDAFKFYRTLGECWYPAQFYAHALPNVRLYAGIRDESGEIQELPEGDWANEQVNRLQDPGGGQSQWLAQFGKIHFLTGDGYLLGTFKDDDEGWEFVSPSELRMVPGGGNSPTKYVRVNAPGATPEDLEALSDDAFAPLESGVVAYRIWNPDPEYSLMADGPIRAALPLYEQLALLEAAVSARARSRLAAAGILLVADELSFGEPTGQQDDDPKKDPFAERLQAAIVKPIKDPNSASAMAPIVLRIPSDFIREKSAMEHIKLFDANEGYPERELREELRDRIAGALDLPPELMKGLATANHWSAWQIDDQSYNAHIKPVLIRMCDSLSSAYLRPLAKQENQGYEQGQLVVWFDPADLINHPDRAQDAKDAFGLGLLKGDVLLESLGFDPDRDRMEGEELAWWESLQGKGADPLVDEEGNPIDAQEAALVNKESSEGAPDEGDAQERALGRKETVGGDAQEKALRLVGAADMALYRCREVAGARIVTAARKPTGCPECAERVREVDNTLVASILGAEQVAEFGLQPQALVAGGATMLRRACEDLGLNGLGDRIATLVENHAAATLYDPEPLPDKVVAYLRKAAGGQA